MLRRRLRRFLLTTHIVVTVGWLGAVAAYLALAWVGLGGEDAQQVRAAFLSMEVIGWRVVVPCALASLVTGLVQSLGTEWGLFRHWWIVAKLLLTVLGTAILLAHLPAVSRVSRVAADLTVPLADLGRLPTQLLVHAAGGLLLLLAATALSVFKPWGRIAVR